MAKIFRIHKNGATNQSGWFDSIAITNKDLKTIITDGKSIATSIPSPFARIDLVKSAFQWVAENGINGNTSQHKLVSDALDVGQLFFLSSLYEELKITEWNPSKRFDELKKGEHKDFIETLETYWNQDGSVYNFDKADRLFFIFYNKQLIGGTSPATLFFAAPDANADSLHMNISRGEDMLFDDKYASLAKREWSYIEYIFSIAETNQFSKVFKQTGKNEFYSYLQAVKKALSPEKLLEVNNLDSNSFSDYEKCFVSGSANNFCDVVGVPLGLHMPDPDVIIRESDFIVQSTLSNKKPLILPFDKFSDKLSYTSKDVKWDGDRMHNKVPYKNKESESQSKLPIYKDSYYWLSIGNFLEDKIIELPYPIDGSKYSLCGSKKHLLPLTKTFFEYFSTDEVEDLLTVSELSAGGVKVKLEIPVKDGRKIPFTKIYNGNDIETLEFHLAVFPFVKVEDFPIKYNIGIIDGDINDNHKNIIHTILYNSGKEIKGSEQVVRSRGENVIKSIYVSSDKYFDCIQLKYNSLNGFIIPKMPLYNPGTAGYNYSIDFGTTNTHIEYHKDGETVKAFKNESPKTIWASLLDKRGKVDPLYIVVEDTFEQEIIPYTIGIDNLSFPLRTALVENRDINYNEQRELFKHLNNFFLYEKRLIQSHLELITSLKWSNYSKKEDKKRVESYIEYLLTIIFYKTLLTNGNLENTKVTWFYPVSMTSFQQGIFEELWKNAYKKIFGKFGQLNNLKKVPESIAPFFYYHNTKGVMGLSVSIDVGGGSSDVSIFDNGKPKVISSFRFAGDSIYGDGYGGSPSVNGFVQAFKDDAYKYLSPDDITRREQRKILQNILETRGSSSDFSSYLFSLSKDSEGLFNYSSLIKEEMNLKLSILVFYAALGYYVSQLLKGGAFEVPRNFLFSGSGAKSLSIIDSSSDLQNISELLKFITEKVIDKGAKKVVSILSEIPKEITCKGGLLQISDFEVNTKFWLGGLTNSKMDLLIDSNTVAGIPKYSDCNKAMLSSIISSVEDFYKILDTYFELVNIEKIFGIKRDAYEKFKEVRSDQLMEFLNKGIEIKIEGDGGNSNIPIEESMFFYPLLGVLNKLSYELAIKE